jgi:hypothetical protein
MFDTSPALFVPVLFPVREDLGTPANAKELTGKDERPFRLNGPQQLLSKA